MILFNFCEDPRSNRAASLYVWTVTFAALFLFSLLKEQVLPPRFFYDSATINSLISEVSGLRAGASYGNTSFFYKMLGISIDSMSFRVASSLIVLWTMFQCLRYTGRRTIGISDFAIFVIFAFFSVVFVPYLGKEFIAFIPTFVLFLFLPLIGRKRAVFLWILLLVVYASVFRTYWLLIAAHLSLLLLASRNRFVPSTAVALSLAMLLLITIGIEYGAGIDVDTLRSSVNEQRIDGGSEDVRTMITPWIGSGSIFYSYGNFLITMVTLAIPLPLFLLFTPYHMSIFFVISATCARIARRVRAYRVSAESNRDRLFETCIAAILAMISVQSLFEPDYGSYLRHLSPFYPLILIASLRSMRSTAADRRIGTPNDVPFDSSATMRTRALIP